MIPHCCVLIIFKVKAGTSRLKNIFPFLFVLSRKGIAYRILLACSMSIITSCLLFGLPWLATCRPCPSDTSEPCPTIGRSGNYKKFQCPPGHYNDLASLFFNTNDDAIKNLFSKDTDSEFHHSSMLIFFVTCFFLSIFSYGVVAPTGLFVPVIVTGAAYGRFVGMIVSGRSNLNHGLFAVLGSASLLGGSMRTTVSLCVIILELTNNLLLLPLIMLVLLVSKTVADSFNGNIYDLLMQAKGFPFLEAHAEPYMRQLTVSDVVTGPLQFFHGIEKVSNIVHILRTTGHNGFPVLDELPLSESPILFGLILRAHLITLLKQKAFMHDPVSISECAVDEFSSDDFAKKGLGHGDRIEDIILTNEEMEMYIDLHPFTNASPYTVLETMSLSKARTLFRQLGLRHLLVVPKIPGVSTSPCLNCSLLLYHPHAAVPRNENPRGPERFFSMLLMFMRETFLSSSSMCLHYCFAYFQRIPVVGIMTRHDFMPEHVLNLHPSMALSRWKRLRFQMPRWNKLF